MEELTDSDSSVEDNSEFDPDPDSSSLSSDSAELLYQRVVPVQQPQIVYVIPTSKGHQLIHQPRFPQAGPFIRPEAPYLAPRFIQRQQAPFLLAPPPHVPRLIFPRRPPPRVSQPQQIPFQQAPPRVSQHQHQPLPRVSQPQQVPFQQAPPRYAPSPVSQHQNQHQNQPPPRVAPPHSGPVIRHQAPQLAPRVSRPQQVPFQQAPPRHAPAQVSQHQHQLPPRVAPPRHAPPRVSQQQHQHQPAPRVAPPHSGPPRSLPLSQSAVNTVASTSRAPGRKYVKVRLQGSKFSGGDEWVDIPFEVKIPGRESPPLPRKVPQTRCGNTLQSNTVSSASTPVGPHSHKASVRTAEEKMDTEEKARDVATRNEGTRHTGDTGIKQEDSDSQSSLGPEVSVAHMPSYLNGNDIPQSTKGIVVSSADSSIVTYSSMTPICSTTFSTKSQVSAGKPSEHGSHTVAGEASRPPQTPKDKIMAKSNPASVHNDTLTRSSPSTSPNGNASLGAKVVPNKVEARHVSNTNGKAVERSCHGAKSQDKSKEVKKVTAKGKTAQTHNDAKAKIKPSTSTRKDASIVTTPFGIIQKKSEVDHVVNKTGTSSELSTKVKASQRKSRSLDGQEKTNVQNKLPFSDICYQMKDNRLAVTAESPAQEDQHYPKMPDTIDTGSTRFFSAVAKTEQRGPEMPDIMDTSSTGFCADIAKEDHHGPNVPDTIDTSSTGFPTVVAKTDQSGPEAPDTMDTSSRGFSTDVAKTAHHDPKLPDTHDTRSRAFNTDVAKAAQHDPKLPDTHDTSSRGFNSDLAKGDQTNALKTKPPGCLATVGHSESPCIVIAAADVEQNTSRVISLEDYKGPVNLYLCLPMSAFKEGSVTYLSINK